MLTETTLVHEGSSWFILIHPSSWLLGLQCIQPKIPLLPHRHLLLIQSSHTQLGRQAFFCIRERTGDSVLPSHSWGMWGVQGGLFYSFRTACHSAQRRAELGIQVRRRLPVCFPVKDTGHLVQHVSSLHILAQDKTKPRTTAGQSISMVQLFSHSILCFYLPCF